MEDKPLATRVIIVRHGQSSYNVEGRVQGHLDESVLTEKGIADAKKVGQALTGIPLQAIYHSPLKRATQTAETIAEVLKTGPTPVPELQAYANLIEVHLPSWEGWLFTEVEAKDPAGLQNWHDYPAQLCMQYEGQDFYPIRAIYEQARQVWVDLLAKHDGGTILLVAHSGINRALLGTGIGLTPERYHSLQQANCNISVLNFPNGLAEPAQLEALNCTDHTGLTVPPSRKSHQALRLLLVRHGETQWNREGRFQGQIDIPLNENGKAQGKRAAEFLKDVQIDFAVSSDMSRPKETAELILEAHPTVKLDLNPEFREISHGQWEGCLESEIEAGYPGELDRWRLTPTEVQMPEGENLQQVWDRAVAAWDAMVANYLAQPSAQQRVGLVVAHDAINKALLCYLSGVGPDKFWCFKQGNGAVSVIDYNADGNAIVQAMNITTHLEGGVLDTTAAGAL